MFIIALLYIAIIWLVFARLKWLRWGWRTGIATVLVGLCIAALFSGFLNHLAPTARVIVLSRVVEMTPNVSGQIIEILVKPNELVRTNAVIFKIDPAPYDAQVRVIQAQLDFQELRLSQMKQLQQSSSGRAFDVEERQSEVDQLKAQLDKANYDLQQTTVVAPADGRVANLALSKGDRATTSKAVLSLIVADAVQLVGIFSQNAYQTVRPGTRVQFALSNNPGHLYTSTIGEAVSGVGEGQIASSGELTRVTSLPMTNEYPALINRPGEIDPLALRPGMSGTATAYAANSRPFDFFGWVLLYGRALALYL